MSFVSYGISYQERDAFNNGCTVNFSARDVRRREFWKNQRILALSIFVGLVSCERCLYSLYTTYSHLPAFPIHHRGAILWCRSQPLQELNILRTNKKHSVIFVPSFEYYDLGAFLIATIHTPFGYVHFV